MSKLGLTADEAVEVDRMRQDLLRSRFAEQASQTQRKAAVARIEGHPAGGLKPWREVITHPTPTSPQYQQAADQYGKPVELFRRTFHRRAARSVAQRRPALPQGGWRPGGRAADQLRPERTASTSTAEPGVALLTWATGTFAYASAVDEAAGRYVGLAGGQHAGVVLAGVSVLVRPDAAAAQMAPYNFGAAGPGVSAPDEASLTGAPGVASPGPTAPTRFYGRVRVDPVRMLRDMGEMAGAVVAQLGRSQAAVTVTVEVEATAPGGFADDVRRTVGENARTLKFETHEFED